jgi:hypothetical protein
VSAIESLYPAMRVRKNKGELSIWYVCPYKIEDDNGKIVHKAVTLRKDREDDDELHWENVDHNELIPIDIVKNPNAGYSNYLALVKTKIEETKNYMLERLANIELDDKRLNEFFELAKDASTGLDVD